MFDILAGNWELAIGNTVIPAELLGDLSPNYEEGEISADTQAGTISTPSGKAETSEFTFTLYLPKQNAAKYLGIIWPEAYTAPSGDQKTGNIIFGTRACMNRTPQPMNIHSNCDTTDDNDMHIYAGVSKIAFNPTLSTSDAASFEVTVYMQPDENGNRFRFGTGDATRPSVYDPTQQKTVPVETAAGATSTAKSASSK